MRQRVLLLAGTAALFAAPVTAQVTDYRLPPAPTPTPRVVGPLPDTPVPRPSPVPTPAPTATTAAPTPTPSPRITAPTLDIPPVTPTVRRPTATPAPTATAQPSRATAPTAVPTAVPTPPATSIAPPAPAFTPPPVVASEQPARSWWPWIVAVFVLAGAAFGGLFWLRRRIGPVGPVVVPEIERPRVPAQPVPGSDPIAAAPTPQPAPDPVQAELGAAPHPLAIQIELKKLTLTLMNATLGYRLTLTNDGEKPLDNITVSADLIGAHGSLPREALLAGPETDLPMRHLLAGLAPGESGDVAGDLKLPLSEVLPIARGNARLFVPLARFRVGADGDQPRYFTLVTGQPSPGGNSAIQPIRLDFGPRSYDGLAGRAF